MAKKKSKRKIVRKTDIETQQNKQLIVFFMIMLISLGGLIAGYLYVQQQNKFRYAGVDFQKGKEGDIVFYHGRFPINYKGQTLKIFNLYLRKDPRKNDVPINTNVSLSKKIVITFEPGLEKCNLAIIGQTTMAQFVSSFPWINESTGAVTDLEYAIENKIPFADCSNASSDKTIILAKKSEKSSIDKSGENCYILNVADCNYLGVSERFVIGMIAQINEKKI